MTGTTGSDSPVPGYRLGVPSVASLMVDDLGVVVAWSSEAERLLGRGEQDVVGRPARDLLVTDLSDDHDIADVVLRHQDGRHVGCRMRVRPEPAGRAGMRWRIEIWPAEDTEISAVDRALLDALFSRSPISLFVLDTDQRLVRYNPAAEGLRGTKAGEGKGKRANEAWPGVSSEENERITTRVLTTGEPAVSYERHSRPPADPDREHIYSASAFRLHAPDGRVLGVGSIAFDITERHRAQERLTLVAEAGSRIGTSLNVMQTAGELADVVVPQLADSATVDLLEPVLTGGEVPDEPGETGWLLRRAASRSIHAVARPAYDVGEVSSYTDSAPGARVLNDHRPLLVPVVGETDPYGPDDPPARHPEDERVHSLMVVPLLVRGRALGLVSFHRWTDRGAFLEEDLTLAQDLAARAAFALDNARLYVRERNSVVTLQHSLVSQEFPAAQTVQAAHHGVHSGAGGDWTDVIPLPGARVALVVGSTPGRGVHTAATMGRLRTAVHTLAALDLAPDELMARLDDLVRQMTGESPGPTADGPLGATCLYVVYDPVSSECTMAAAGSSGLATVGPEGVALPETAAGPPLGRPGPPFGKTTVRLPGQARLVLFTPGLLQAYSEDEGREELVRVLSASPESSPRDLCPMLTKALVSTAPSRDAVVLVADTRPLDNAQVATWVLPTDPAAVATARSLTNRQLSNWSMDDEAFPTELIVSELVTNAIRYARPPIQLRLIHDRTLSVEVSDGSSAAPYLRHARTTDEGGRGLMLVSQFAQRWGARYEENGKTIWVEDPTAPEF